MDYYCAVCTKLIKPKSKFKHFKSNTHKEFERCKHIEISTEKPNINKVDRIFYSYNIENDKKYDYYCIICQFRFFFNDYQYCPHVTSKFSDNKTLISWSIFLKKK